MESEKGEIGSSFMQTSDDNNQDRQTLDNNNDDDGSISKLENKLINRTREKQLKQEQDQLEEQDSIINNNNNNRDKEAINLNAAILKSKFGHRSQSSPSSLTTHKFGLRPTPSPPRLIIDHNTGDIIESYPERQTYLRTYQPISTEDEDYDDCELIGGRANKQVELSSKQMSGQSHNNNITNRALIPPPHSSSGKVYFAPPEPTGAGASHLFYNRTSPHTNWPKEQQVLNLNSNSNSSSKIKQANNNNLIGLVEHNEGKHHLIDIVNLNTSHNQSSDGQWMRGNELSGSGTNNNNHNNSSFRRALNKLNDSMAQQTDIAIVTEENDFPISKSQKLIITATPNHLINLTTSGQQQQSNQLLLNQKQRNQLIKQDKINDNKLRTNNININNHNHLTSSLKRDRKKLPSIEDFNIYNLNFIFRLLLVLLISIFIIYLLLVPLVNDCSRYRPTYSYISIIICSVNLICIIIFSLFWYSSEVTRTLYANLSSSAFIVSSYSILVAVNLALGILLFLVDTCHFQRMIANRSNLIGSSSDPFESSSPLIQLNQGGGINIQELISSSLLIKSKSPMDERLTTTTTTTIDSMLLEDDHPTADYVNVRWRKHSQFNEDTTSTTTTTTTTTKPSISLGSLIRNERSNQVINFHNNRLNSIRRTKNEQHDDLADDDFMSSSKPANLPPDGRSAEDEYDDNDEMQRSTTSTSVSVITTLNSNGGENINEQFNYEHEHFGGMNFLERPKMSPIEAFWLYLSDQFQLLRRHFKRFLLRYDLKFIGALHALCAICLQYLAMKVAVVRSHFCSPVYVLPD